MSIYRLLNPRLLVQPRLGLGLLHWANMSNISLTLTIITICRLTKAWWRWIGGCL